MRKHTILFLAANPLGANRLALDEEARAIQEELERSGHRDQFELVTRWAVQPLDLLRELRKVRPTVVHFSGRGGRGHVVDDSTFLHGNAQEGLFFRGRGGRPQLAPTRGLLEAVDAAGSSVKVVVLSACYSKAQAEILRDCVDCVVGMHGSISEDATRSFAIGFYGGLAEGASIAGAFRQGRAAVRLEGLTDGEKPQLEAREGVDADNLVLATPHWASTPAALSKLGSAQHGEAADEVPGAGLESITVPKVTLVPIQPRSFMSLAVLGSPMRKLIATAVTLSILTLVVRLVVSYRRDLSASVSMAVLEEPPIRVSVIKSINNAGRTILWVDDHPENNDRERRWLEAQGVRFRFAASNAEALEQLRFQPPDVVISDMHRRGDLVAGYALLEAMRQSGIAIPAIIYSDHGPRERRAEARRLGAFGCTGSSSELFDYVLAALRMSSS